MPKYLALGNILCVVQPVLHLEDPVCSERSSVEELLHAEKKKKNYAGHVSMESYSSRVHSHFCNKLHEFRLYLVQRKEVILKKKPM